MLDATPATGGALPGAGVFGWALGGDVRGSWVDTAGAALGLLAPIHAAHSGATWLSPKRPATPGPAPPLRGEDSRGHRPQTPGHRARPLPAAKGHTVVDAAPNLRRCRGHYL